MKAFSMAHKWYAAKLKSNREQQANFFLNSRSVECFLPLYKSVSKRLHRRRSVLKPLFPGYLFVHIANPGPQKIHILQCPGFVDFISFNQIPAPIDDQVINSLKILTHTNQGEIRPHPLLKKGQLVKVLLGPFSGAIGRLLKNDQDAKLVVEIPFLGRAASVFIEPENVTPIFIE